MFSLRDTLAKRRLPPGYNINMGIVMHCGRRPASITRLGNSPCPESVVDPPRFVTERGIVTLI
jgi:hypothetical protein